MSALPIDLSTLRREDRSFFVHISENQPICHGRRAGWYRYDEILIERGFTPQVAALAVRAATNHCEGPCVWIDWLDPMFLNCHSVFEEVVAVPPIHMTQKHETVKGAFDALKPFPYDATAWLPQRSRVMRMLIEILNQDKALQSALVSSHPWPLAAVIARNVQVVDERSKVSDHFWGIDIHSGGGENTMGRLLQEYRDHLVATSYGSSNQSVDRSVSTSAVTLSTTGTRLSSTNTASQQQRCIVRISPTDARLITTGLSCVIVIDTSGSMKPHMELLRQLLRHLLTGDVLGPTDEITFVQFASDARTAEEADRRAGLGGPLTAEKRDALVAFVDGLEAAGVTNLSAGVLRGLEQLNKARVTNTKCLCILTDGTPFGDPLLEESGAYSQALLRKAQEIAAVGSTNVFPIGFQRNIDSAPLSALASCYNGEFEYVLTIEEAKSKCEEILHQMKCIVTRNLTLRAEVSPAGVVTEVNTSCETRTNNATTFEAFIVDQYSGETPRDVAFTLVSPVQQAVSVAYTLSFTDVRDSTRQTLALTVTLPDGQPHLRPSDMYYDAVNGLRYMEAVNTVKRMIDDETPAAAALIGRGRRPHATRNTCQPQATWSKILELKLALGFLRFSPVRNTTLEIKLLKNIEALEQSPEEGAHVNRGLHATRGGR
jgi:Mg-chelatase subunit ChlD